MNHQDYKSARDFLANKAKELMKHEEKNFAHVGFPPQSYTRYPIGKRIFYAISTNVFKEIIDSILQEAVARYPNNFGTGNALDVLEAIYKTEPMYDLETFKEMLKTEQFCCVIENINGEIQKNILRIDLYRKLDPRDKKFDFTGGLFHAFKHFSLNGVSLSTGREINDIHRPSNIISLIIMAFFMEERLERTSKEFYSVKKYGEKHVFKFGFYFEEVTKVYFLNTIHIG